MAAVETVRAQQIAAFLMSNADLVKGRVLDVGCGSSPYAQLFPDCEWVGLDTRPVGAIVADMCDMGDIGEFDTVVCLDSLGLTPTPHKAVEEMARVLKSGGHVLIAARVTADDDAVYFGIHSAGLSSLIHEAGLTGVEGEKRHVALGGQFSRGEADNFWTNMTWLEGVGNDDIDRFTAYLDRRYPAIAGSCAVKP